jgi:hypothetical protein
MRSVYMVGGRSDELERLTSSLAAVIGTLRDSKDPTIATDIERLVSLVGRIDLSTESPVVVIGVINAIKEKDETTRGALDALQLLKEIMRDLEKDEWIFGSRGRHQMFGITMANSVALNGVDPESVAYRPAVPGNYAIYEMESMVSNETEWSQDSIGVDTDFGLTSESALSRLAIMIHYKQSAMALAKFDGDSQINVDDIAKTISKPAAEEASYAALFGTSAEQSGQDSDEDLGAALYWYGLDMMTIRLSYVRRVVIVDEPCEKIDAAPRAATGGRVDGRHLRTAIEQRGILVVPELITSVRVTLFVSISIAGHIRDTLRGTSVPVIYERT